MSFTVPRADGMVRRYALALVAALIALPVIVLVHWTSGMVVLTPSLFAVVLVTWYYGIGPGLFCFAVVAIAAPFLMAAPIGADYSARQYFTSLAIAAPLALVMAYVARTARSTMQSLHRSEVLFEAFMGHLPGPAWMKDSMGRYAYANEDALRTLRQSRATLYGRTDADLFAPALADQLHVPDALPLARREVVERVETYRQADGAHDYLVVRFPIMGETLEPELVGAVGIDITERMRAERQLAERSAQLQMVIDQVPALVSYIDRDHQLVVFNRRLYQEWYGMPAGDLHGKRVDEIVAGDIYDPFRPYVDRALAGETVEYESLVRTTDGSSRWIEAKYLPHRDSDGTVAGFFSLVLDITRRKQRELERNLLTRITEQLNRTLDTEETARALVTALVPSFVDGAAIYFADAGQGVHGVVIPSPATADPVSAMYRVDPSDERGIGAVLRGGSAEYYRRTPEGIAVPLLAEGDTASSPPAPRVSTMVVPIHVDGRIVAVLSAWTAESERSCEEQDFELLHEVARRAGQAFGHSLLYEESLRIAEELRIANGAKDEFLGTVSHELRTPITVVLGNASLLATRHEQMDEATISASLNDLLGQAERLHRVVENMLILTRLETGTVDTEPVLISSSIGRVISEAQRQQPGRVIRLESRDWDLFALGAEAYIHQVMLNYLQNAIRYSALDTPIDVTVQQQGHTVEVRVLDQGIGLTPEELQTIFTPFYRSPRIPEDQRGIGIGLSVCKRLIEALGGTVWARPRDDAGAEFGFSLPVALDVEAGALDLVPPVAVDATPAAADFEDPGEVADILSESNE